MRAFDNAVADAANWNVIFLWTVFVIGSYHILEYVFPICSARFSQLTFGQRRYVIKNILKSIIIISLAIYTTKAMINLFLYAIADNQFIHTVGLLYAIPDLYGLYWLAPTGLLKNTTKFHHISVGVLATLGLLHDYNVENYWSAMLIYAYLSMWTGCVNFYLGFRYLINRESPNEDRCRRGLAKTVLWIYIYCCCLNWLYQVHTVMLWIDFRWHTLTLTTFCGLSFYCGILIHIIRDDIDLIQSLIRHCEPYQKKKTIDENVNHFIRALQALQVLTQPDSELVYIIHQNSAHITFPSSCNVDFRQLAAAINNESYTLMCNVKSVILTPARIDE